MGKTITLAGFGDFSENPDGYAELKRVADSYGLELYETYFDHELKGDRDTIEKLTIDMWGMHRDEWDENLLMEREVEDE